MVDLPIYDLPDGQHCCEVFDTTREQHRLLGRFIAQGLGDGSKVVCIADPPSARRVLASHAADPIARGAVERGQLRLHGSEDAYLAGGEFDPARMVARLVEEVGKGLAEGYPSVRISGDVTWWARPYPGVELLLDYERRVGDALAGTVGSAMCQYDRRRLPASVLREACAAHGWAASRQPLASVAPFQVLPEGPGSFVLEGELDLTGADALTDALDTAVADGADRLVVDLRALRFIDASGAAALCRPAVKGTAMLLLRDPQPLVAKVLSLLGFERIPTMKIERGGPR